jgi:hypothetical protein
MSLNHFEGTAALVLKKVRNMEFSLMKIIKHNHKIHNMGHKFALTDIWAKYQHFLKHKIQK